MIRLAAGGGLALALVVMVGSSLRGQPVAPRVEYRDKKDGNIRTIDGELKPGAVGYQVIPTGSKVPVTIPAADIVRVLPGELPPLERTKDLLPLFDLEKKDPAKALQTCEELRKRPGLTPKAKQFLEFKRAMLTARLSDDAADEAAWKDKAKEAANQLELYLTTPEYATGWELWPTARACARIQLELGEPQKAAAAWAAITREGTDLPPDARVEATLQEIDAHIRNRAWTEAAGKAKTLTTAAGAAKEKVNIYSIAAKFGPTAMPADGVKPIEDEIAKTKDPTVRAAGFAMIGELYLAAKKPRDAMWAFLWVEVVYNTDRDEVTRALIRLKEYFTEQGEEERAKTYREKLRRYTSAL